MVRPEFVSDIMDPVLKLEGDKLPVSAFEPGGYQPIGTSQYEKRGIAPSIPVRSLLANICLLLNVLI